MKRAAILTILLISLFASNLFAVGNSFNYTCDFMEKLGDRPWQVVDSRSFAAPFDTAFQFSMGNFSYRLTATRMTDTVVQIESQVNCQSSPNRNFFDRNVVFKGAALFYDSALVRGNSIFRIKLVFDSIGASRTHCDYSFADTSFRFDPSGDFDFHFVKNSLGDYHWNSIRDAFEKDYDGLVERFHLTDRTKINFYICPCPPADIGWDPRWNNGYDYSRHNVFAYYDHGVNALEPEVVYMLRLMRIYGYAPAFLLEGVATSLEYCEVWARDAYRNKTLPDITTLGESRKYRAIDRDISAYAAGSFVNYVLNTKGRGRLLDWYQSATDLTLVETFNKVYEQPMAEVVGEWHNYLDTLTLTNGSLSYYSSRAQTFLKYPEMTIYAEKAMSEGGGTSWAAQSLSSLYYTYGDYERAGSMLKPLLADSNSAKQARIFYANMLLATGKLDSAKKIYETSSLSDTTVHVIPYKLGLIAESRGKFADALEHFRKARSMTTSPASGVDYDISLGDAFAGLKQPDSAASYYQRALNDAKILVGSYNDNSLHHLRMGRAAVRLNSPDLAAQELELAFFLEERMFYIGQILLAKGETFDLKKDRKSAVAEYRKVLDLPTAYLEKQQARKYLKSPYKN